MQPPSNIKAQKRIVGMFAYYSKFIKNFSEKIRILNQNSEFPAPEQVISAFQLLKNDIKDAMLVAIDPNDSFEVETDASDFCIAATLSQQGRPVAFFSRTLNKSECHHPAVEKEAAAVVESLSHWRYFLLGRQFSVTTDQRSISFMYDKRRRSKIKMTRSTDGALNYRSSISQSNIVPVKKIKLPILFPELLLLTIHYQN